jgi:WD40 repeat protein
MPTAASKTARASDHLSLYLLIHPISHNAILINLTFSPQFPSFTSRKLFSPAIPPPCPATVYLMTFHAYLSHRIPTPGEKGVSIVAWNHVNKLIACSQTNGVISLMFVTSNPDRPGDFKIEIIASFVEHKHCITSLIWNERFTKLASGDSSGMVIVWTETTGKWRPRLAHSWSQSPVTSISRSLNSESMAITYADGHIACGDIHGNTRWEMSTEYELVRSCWAIGARALFVVTKNGAILLVRSVSFGFQKLILTVLASKV